jgi:hypothetical protein
VGFVALRDAKESSQFLSMVGREYGQEIDASDWERHWKVTSAIMLFTGLVGAAAGVGMVGQRRWSLLLLAITPLASLLFDLWKYGTSYTKYAFEQAEPVEILLLISIVIASLFWFLRWKGKISAVHSDS